MTNTLSSVTLNFTDSFVAASFFLSSFYIYFLLFKLYYMVQVLVFYYIKQDV